MSKKQETFDNIYDLARDKGFSPYESLRFAKEAIVDIPDVEEITGKKSFSVDGSFTGNVLDVSFGSSGVDTEEIFGGMKLDPSGWMKPPSKEFTGDLNHYTFDMVEGVRNDLPEEWQHFRTKAKDFYNTVNEKGEIELRGKVYVPENDLGKQFIEKYNNGEFGVSVEYKGYLENGVVKDWEITGYTFHEDPSYDTKRNKPKDL